MPGVRSSSFNQSFHVRHRGHGETGTPDVKRLQRVHLAPAFDADHVLARHPHGLQRQLVGRRAALAHLGLVFADDQALGVPVDDEAGDAFSCLGIEAHDAAHTAIGDPHLRASQLPVVVPEPPVALPQLGDIREMDSFPPRIRNNAFSPGRLSRSRSHRTESERTRPCPTSGRKALPHETPAWRHRAGLAARLPPSGTNR